MLNLLVIGSIVVLAFIIGWISSYLLGKNNPIEEACEDVIKKETGIDVELSTTSDQTSETK